MFSSFASLRRLSSLLLLATSILSSCSKKEAIVEPDIPNANIAPRVGVAGIAGANWADARDNFVDGWVIPSGLTASDSYATVQAKADKVLAGFQTAQINTVRLPINPPSVLESWWGSYNGAIDKAVSRNMNVILAVWEAGSARDGRVDDLNQFWSMWQTVMNRYRNNPRVYFEVFNEPHGYNLSDLTNLYAEFLSRYPSVPRNRILLGGTGYSQNVTQIGADGRLANCLLAIHDYSFFANDGIKTALDWENRIKGNIGAYANRTVFTEFGAPMTNGKNYTGPINADAETAFIQGISNACRDLGIASVYWPGVRDNDFYALYTFNGTTMTLTNPSGLSRLQYGWSIGKGGTDTFYPGAYYRIINRHSGRLADVNGQSTVDGGSLIQWPATGGNNQQWQILSNGDGFYRIINRNSGKALEVPGYSVTNGQTIDQWVYNGGNNQHWQILDNGGDYYRIINRHSGQALEVPGYSVTDATNLTQWPFNGGNNQQWQLLQQ
ncbi:MAG: RICIN domain-containing protein [Bacteroidota bacterium]